HPETNRRGMYLLRNTQRYSQEYRLVQMYLQPELSDDIARAVGPTRPLLLKEPILSVLMLFLRALFAFLALPTVVGGVVPWLILRNDHPRTAGTLLGWPISLFGGSVLLWCVRDFYVVGKGTLAPWDPPKKLVTV